MTLNFISKIHYQTDTSKFKHPATPKKYEKVQDQYFSFMNPLAVEIWLYIAVAYILVSLTMWIVARFSPFEWQMRNECEENWLNNTESIRVHQCKRHQNNQPNDIDSIDNENHEDSDDNNKITRKMNRVESIDSINGSGCVDDRNLNYPDLFSGTKDYLGRQEQGGLSSNESRFDNCTENEIHEIIENELQSIENDFTLRNSFWFAIGTLMQQGSDLNPKVYGLSSMT